MNRLGMIECELQGDYASVRMSRDMCACDVQLAHQSPAVIGLIANADDRSRVRTVAEAATPVAHQFKAAKRGLREHREVGVCEGAAMDEDRWLASSVHFVLELIALDGHLFQHDHLHHRFGCQ